MPTEFCDAMKEEFEDSNSSRIVKGPFASYTRSNESNSKDDVKDLPGIHIGNLPISITKDALTNLLSEHGKVEQLFIGKPPFEGAPKTWAIARLKNKRALIDIIAGLNQVPPLNLKISVARESQGNKPKSNTPLFNNQPRFGKIGSSESIASNADSKNMNGQEINHDKSLTKQKENGLVLMNGMNQNPSNNDKRKLSLNGDNSIDIQSNASDQTSQNGDENARMVLLSKKFEQLKCQMDGRSPEPAEVLSLSKKILCIFCELHGTLRCSICYAWYCSKECQIEDWYLHSKGCRPPPPLLNGSSLVPKKIQSSVYIKIPDVTYDEVDRSSIQSYTTVNNNNNPIDSTTKSTIEINSPSGNNIIKETFCDQPITTEKDQPSSEIIQDTAEINIIKDNCHISPVSDSSSSISNKFDTKTISSDVNKEPIPVKIASNESLNHIKKESSNVLTPTTKVIDSNLPNTEVLNKVDKTSPLATFKSALPLLDLNTSHLCFINSIDENKYSIILKCEESTTLLTEGFNALKKCENNLPVSPLKERMAVAFYSPLHSGWCRGYITQVLDNSAFVFSVDLGGIEELPKSSFKDLPEGICRKASALLLSGKRIGECSNEKYLNKMVNSNEMVEITVVAVKSDKVKVVILDPDTSEGIATLIIKSYEEVINITQDVEKTNSTSKDLDISLFSMEKAKQTKSIMKEDQEELIKSPKARAPSPIIENNQKKVTINEETEVEETFSCNIMKQIPLSLNEKMFIQPVWMNDNMEIYAHIFTEEITKDFLNLVTSINKHVKNSLVPKVIGVSDMVCVYLNEEQKWYRGEVLQIKGEDYYIRIIDYGEIKMVSKSNIRNFNNEIASFPIFAIKFFINGISSANKKAEADILKMIETQKPVYMKLITFDPPTANLYDSSDKVLFSSYIENNNLDSSTPKKDSPRRTTLSDCKNLTLNVGKKESIIIMNVESSMNIFALPSKDSKSVLEELDTLSKDMCTFCDAIKQPNYCPEQGEVVLAKFSDDGQWYRALMLTVGDTSGYAMFLDWGNFSEVDFTSIVPMNKKFLEIPLAVVQCCLEDTTIEDNTPEFISQLKEFLEPGSQHTIKVLSLDDSVYNITIEDPE